MSERTPRMRKVTQYPQPHRIDGGFSFEFDDVTLDSTIVPIAFYDEGLGAANVRETHPQNAAFAVVTDEANCFPHSRINLIIAQFRFSLNSNFIDDNLTHLRFGTLPIHMAFINDYTAIDELSVVAGLPVGALINNPKNVNGFILFTLGAIFKLTVILGLFLVK